MPDVEQRGLDSSGRPVRASRVMWSAWDAACSALGFTPTIVQGGFMGDAGADASAGTHAGDAFDVRLWDRTATERDEMIRVFRSHGLAYWERYESQGFDLHAHMIPGPWAHPAPGALDQWQDYLDGRNGLASNGADYHWRPNPIITEPPEDDMAEYGERILSKLDRIEQRDRARGKRRHEAILALLDKLADDVTDNASRAQVKRVRVAIDALAEPDPEPEP